MANVFRSVLASARAILQSKTVTAGTSSQTVTPDSGYDGFESVTVNPTPTETKSDTPNVSTNKTVTPSSGKYLSQVTIQPLTHSGTYTPAANTAQNDMGAYHDKRYVNTSGMIVPSGAKSITANGTGIDVSSYATANVNVPNPTLSGNATAADVANGKTFYNNTYTKQTGSYVAPTINNITPSNSSPVSMSANNNYKPSANGYAIESYENVTPTESGTYFSSGMKNMRTSGYAYSSQPAVEAEFTKIGQTRLTTNKATTITLTDNLSNYKAIIITEDVVPGNESTGVSGSTYMYLLVPVSYFVSQGLFTCASTSGSSWITTIITYASDTQISFKQSSAVTKTYYVCGIK